MPRTGSCRRTQTLPFLTVAAVKAAIITSDQKPQDSSLKYHAKDTTKTKGTMNFQKKNNKKLIRFHRRYIAFCIIIVLVYSSRFVRRVRCVPADSFWGRYRKGIPENYSISFRGRFLFFFFFWAFVASSSIISSSQAPSSSMSCHSSVVIFGGGGGGYICG